VGFESVGENKYFFRYLEPEPSFPAHLDKNILGFCQPFSIPFHMTARNTSKYTNIETSKNSLRSDMLKGSI
jgi:hypothetical protein